MIAAHFAFAGICRLDGRIDGSKQNAFFFHDNVCRLCRLCRLSRKRSGLDRRFLNFFFGRAERLRCICLVAYG